MGIDFFTHMTSSVMWRIVFVAAVSAFGVLGGVVVIVVAQIVKFWSGIRQILTPTRFEARNGRIHVYRGLQSHMLPAERIRVRWLWSLGRLGRVVAAVSFDGRHRLLSLVPGRRPEDSDTLRVLRSL